MPKIPTPVVHLEAQNNYFIPNVPPLATTNQRLGGGKYCLGVDSTIPFVSFQGGGFAQKIISWGEMIEIPKGQTVTIKNESFMQGDISINSGHDFAAHPERISTPLLKKTISIDAFPGVTFYTGTFSADTRRCRRAFLNFVIETALTPINLFFLGRSAKHSFPAIDNLAIPGFGPFSYQSNLVIAPLTLDTSENMGYSLGLNKDLPHGLTDKVDFYIADLDGTATISNLFMYVLEY